MNKYEKLRDLLDDLECAETERQESCSCHINPPCSYCCDESANDAMTAIDEFITDWSNKE